MDILIKNMEMPKSCNGCKLATHYFTNTHKVRCFINAEMREAEDIESRPSWCPLVALPEHGIISVHKVLDYLAERAEISKEMGDEETASLFASMSGDILAMSVEATE